MHRPRDARPCRRLLRHGQHVRMLPMYDRVKVFEEGDGFEVLVSAVPVRNPFPGLARVVEVDHRGDGVHAQPVQVVPVEPEQSVREQEVAHLGPAEVEDRGPPVLVPAEARIGVLVEVSAVEEAQAVLVHREVRRDPVQDHPDSLLVATVDEVHEVVGVAEATGRREVAGGLIPPGGVEGVLGDREQLDVREAQLAHVRDQLLGQLPVGEPAVPLLRPPLPGAEVDLVDRDGPVEPVALGAPGGPFRVVPGVAIQVVDHRRRPRPQLRAKRVRVGFLHPIVVELGPDLVLVAFPGREPRDEKLPDPDAWARPHRVAPPVPAVEVPDDADPLGVGRPHREQDPVDPAHRARVRAEHRVGAKQRPFAEEVQVEVAQDRPERVGIDDLARAPVLSGQDQPVAEQLRSPGEERLEESVRVDPLHRLQGPAGEIAHVGARRLRQEGAHGHGRSAPDLDRVRAEDVERVVVGPGQDARQVFLRGGRGHRTIIHTSERVRRRVDSGFGRRRSPEIRDWRGFRLTRKSYGVISRTHSSHNNGVGTRIGEARTTGGKLLEQG